jgi:hypothetical protein
MNVHFQRKMVADELWDTLYLATMEYPTKTKLPEVRIMECEGFFVEIYNMRRIFVNGERCESIRAAKHEICTYL